MSTPIFREVGLPAKNINNLSYAGPLLNIVPILGQDRAPTSNNYRFPVSTFWNNTNDLATLPDQKGDLWYMAKKSQYQATWIKLSGGGTGPLLQFTPSSGSVVFPNPTSGNVNMTAGNGITVTGTSETLTFALKGGGIAVQQFTPTSGIVVTPNATTGNVNMTAGSGISITGTSETLTFALVGGGTAIDSIGVDAATPPGTNPVVSNGSGQTTITGGQVASGTVGANAIRTNSLSANAFTIQIQRSAAAGSSSVNNAGISSYNSSYFTIDSNGYVGLTTTGTIKSINVQRFTTPGAFTYTPTVNTLFAIFQLQAAGAGSGGTQATTANAAAAGGGSAGGFASFILTAVQIGASLTGSVGGGGAGGSAGNNAGSNGGNTTLATTSPWTCAGGTGGAGGAAGATSVTNLSPGGAVTTGTGSILFTSQGGSSSVGTANSANIAISGAGGSSILGNGAYSIYSNVSPNGSNGSTPVGYGSGACGACSFGTIGPFAGAAGGDGIVIVTEYIG